jgi:four helix bundle protein
MSSARSERLTVWKLSEQLRLEIKRLTRRERMDCDYRLRSQIRDAAAEISRNIAEALAADRDRDCARFARLARADVSDLQNALRTAVMKKFVAEADLKAAREIVARLYPALSSFLAPPCERRRSVRAHAVADSPRQHDERQRGDHSRKGGGPEQLL